MNWIPGMLNQFHEIFKFVTLDSRNIQKNSWKRLQIRKTTEKIRQIEHPGRNFIPTHTTRVGMEIPTRVPITRNRKNSFSLPVMKSIPIFWSYNPSRRTSYALAWVCPILVKFIFLTSSWKNVQSMFRPAQSYKKILNKGIWIRDSLANNLKVLYYSSFKQIICNCIIRIPPTCYNAKTVHLT